MRRQQWDRDLDRIHPQVSQRQHWRAQTDNGNAIFDSGKRLHRCRRTGGLQLSSSWTTREDYGIDLIVEPVWEVTQDQDKASKIEKNSSGHRGTSKIETTVSNVVRRKLNFQQLESAPGTPLRAVIKDYATLRDAKLAESSCDKAVMWTGDSYEYDDVVRALVRLDRPEMRHGTSGRSGKTVPTFR